MQQIINIIISVLLVTMCVSSVLAIVVFWYIVLAKLLDSVIGVKPTDKEIEEMTK